MENEKRPVKKLTELVSGICDENEKIRKILEELAEAEKTYRYIFESFGAGNIRTGRAWDVMRKTGDKAREVLNEKKN